MGDTMVEVLHREAERRGGAQPLGRSAQDGCWMPPDQIQACPTLLKEQEAAVRMKTRSERNQSKRSHDFPCPFKPEQT